MIRIKNLERWHYVRNEMKKCKVRAQKNTKTILLNWVAIPKSLYLSILVGLYHFG